MIRTVGLTPASEALAADIAAASQVESGTVVALDLTTDPAQDAWEEWVSTPSSSLMALLDKDTRDARADRMLVALRFRSDGDPALEPVAHAAREAMRAIVGCAVLDRAKQGFRANVLLVRDTTPLADLSLVAAHLLDEMASGFTDGATIDLTRTLGSSHTKTRDESSGRRALITGAASGIGLAAARAFAAAGYELVLTDIDEAGLGEATSELGGSSIAGDITEYDLLDALADQLKDGLDALVVAHGVSVTGDLGDLDRVGFERGFNINATGPYRIVDRLRPSLSARRPASVSIVSSAQGLVTMCCGEAGYSASKFAVVGFAQGSIDPLAEDGITVNVLCPGWVDTPFHVKLNNVEGARAGGAETPVGRIGTPEEMAEALLMLSSLQSTGVVYAPTGGETRV